jgi:hypothetical protein
MSDEKEMAKFIRTEWAYRIFFIVYLTEQLVWFWLVWVRKDIDYESAWNNAHNYVTSVIQMVFLTVAYYKLTKHMKLYHLFRYVEIRRNLKIFYCLFVLNTILNFLIASVIGLISDKNEKDLLSKISAYWGYIYPVILCCIITFTKDSKDPLQGISKLNLVIIISIN